MLLKIIKQIINAQNVDFKKFKRKLKKTVKLCLVLK